MEDYTCRADISTEEALSRLNSVCASPFQIVTDAKGHLQGTLTDGDVRRGILSGRPISAPVSEFMSRSPDFVCVNDFNSGVFRETSNRFVPIVDTHSRVIAVALRDVSPKISSDVMIMAGGFGKRLGDITKDLPKALVELGGRPLIDRLLEQFEQIGVERVFVSTYHLSEKVEEFLATRKNRCEVKVLVEDEPLGTAGSVRLLPDDITDFFYVVNCDVVSAVPFQALEQFNKTSRLDGVVGVSEYQFQVPFGVIEYDENLHFQSVSEKPSICHFVAAGVYLLPKKIIDFLPSKGVIDMPELLIIARDAGCRLGLFPIHEHWQDVGTPRELIQASSFLEGE
ncbi:sugar phosphate nucleotidyltransferase [Paracoccaceae bacterium]|nr:sugar phosphate nucleotidyltransferase [Paracoccaceae bacterium]